MIGLVFGCDKPSGTNAGLTNGPPPSSSAKQSVRSDLPGSAEGSTGEILGRTGVSGTSGGTGAMGGGNQGGDTSQPKLGATASSETVRANPAAKDSSSPSSAAGGTKPAGGQIETGTPRSPQ